MWGAVYSGRTRGRAEGGDERKNATSIRTRSVVGPQMNAIRRLTKSRKAAADPRKPRESRAVRPRSCRRTRDATRGARMSTSSATSPLPTSSGTTPVVQLSTRVVGGGAGRSGPVGASVGVTRRTGSPSSTQATTAAHADDIAGGGLWNRGRRSTRRLARKPIPAQEVCTRHRHRACWCLLRMAPKGGDAGGVSVPAGVGQNNICWAGPAPMPVGAGRFARCVRRGRDAAARRGASPVTNAGVTGPVMTCSVRR